MSWITAPSIDCLALEAELEGDVAGRVQAGKYSRDDAQYVSKISLSLCRDGGLSLSDARLEKLRHLCQLWDVDIHMKEISSHRPFVGRLIVGVKRALYPIIKVFLRDFIRQQRAFNAEAIALLAELSNEKNR